jgi:hypothetical protein
VEVLGSGERFFVNTPLGTALVWAVSDEDTVELGMRFHTWQIETKEPWTWSNSHVRIGGSITARRGDWHTPIHVSDDMLEMLIPHIRRHKQSPFYWKVSQ